MMWSNLPLARSCNWSAIGASARRQRWSRGRRGGGGAAGVAGRARRRRVGGAGWLRRRGRRCRRGCRRCRRRPRRGVGVARSRLVRRLAPALRPCRSRRASAALHWPAPASGLRHRRRCAVMSAFLGSAERAAGGGEHEQTRQSKRETDRHESRALQLLLQSPREQAASSSLLLGMTVPQLWHWPQSLRRSYGAASAGTLREPAEFVP